MSNWPRHASRSATRAARSTALQRGQRDAPNEPELFDREGQVWQQLGDPTRAMAAYRKVATLAPKDALVRWRMGELLLSQRQPDQALVQFRQATALDPTVADYWNSLGMVLGGSGQHDEAARAFREAGRGRRKNARYAYNLGLVLMRAGRPEAAEWFRRALSLDPVVQTGAGPTRGTGAMTRRRPVDNDGAMARQAAGVFAALALAAATVLTFRPVVDHPFLNWDDPDVVAANPRLQQPLGRSLVRGRSPPARWATTSRCRGWRWPPSAAGPSRRARFTPSPWRCTR